MNKQEYMAVKVIEEAAEVIQRACKSLCFGWAESQPGQDKDNEERFVGEFNDLLAVVEMLQGSGVPLRGIANPIAIAKKKARVDEFMNLSREQGTLVDELSKPIDNL